MKKFRRLVMKIFWVVKILEVCKSKCLRLENVLGLAKENVESFSNSGVSYLLPDLKD